MSAQILIVEDNAADARLSRLAVQRAEKDAQIVVVDDGIPALKYLKRQAPFEEQPPPDLVLLDLNLRLLDGLDVLRWMRLEPSTRNVPVIVYSSSPEDAQMEAAAKADRYVEKPGDLDEYMKIGQIVADFIRSRGKRQVSSGA